VDSLQDGCAVVGDVDFVLSWSGPARFQNFVLEGILVWFFLWGRQGSGYKWVVVKIGTIPFGPRVVLIISLRAIAPTNIDYKVLDGGLGLPFLPFRLILP
jgi:hypothetical protein